MKKSRTYQILWLLLVLCVFLAGCGSKKSQSPSDPKNPPTKPPANTIQFSLPESYMDPQDGLYYPIAPGKNVQFYILTEGDETEKVEAVETFSGKTRDNTLKFTLPENLKGLQCYIYAVVELNDAYELNGKTISEAMEAAEKGEILFGSILDRDKRAIRVTLNNNVTFGNFTFIGKGEGQPEKSIFFAMPDIYWVGETESEIIPANLEIKIYSVSGYDESGKIITDHTFTGTTGVERIRCTLPDSLDGANRKFAAVIYLKESPFKLDGKTKKDVEEAMQNGEILFGQVDEEYSLVDGVEIENFKFYGPLPNGVIKFEMPTKCVTGTTIPSGKTVKFYAISDTEVLPLEADHVFEGTTGSSIIECELPREYFDRDYYFFAVIVLEGDFDLRGKKPEDLRNPVNSKQIMFGQAKEDGEDAQNILYTLEDGLVVRGFKFIDRLEGQSNPPLPNGVIGFEMPTECVTGTPIPSGKTVKFYAIIDTEVLPLEADHVFEGTTGSSIIECELPGEFIDRKYYFFAVIVLEGDFDLRGKKPEDLRNPVNSKQIMFGQAKEEGEDEEDAQNILYTLEDGLVVRGFKFTDQLPDQTGD